jgi:hypothetical protein
LALVAIATVSLFGSSAVADGLDVGSTAAVVSDLHACDRGTTFFQDAVAGAPGYAATSSGVVTSFSMLAQAFNPGSVDLRIAHEGPDNTYTITGASEAHALAAARLNSFFTRIPIKTGDVLAIHVPKENTSSVGCDFDSGNAGDVVRWRTGNAFDDPVGTTVVTDTTGPSFRLNVSARIEPDADGDGYGDLTQDACPALKNSHDDCIPPNTFLKSGPAKKVVTAASKAKVKITFFASEAASFTCKVDKNAAMPCNGKFKAKLKPGKHTVTITATDKVGNVDPTPLVVKTKVVHQS